MDCFASVSSLARTLLPDSSAGAIRLGNDSSSSNVVRSRDEGPVDVLALGSGWTWSFLGPAAGERGLKTAYTTRQGSGDSIQFTFDPESDDTEPFEALPDATTIVIIFPLYSAEAARRLVHGYVSTRRDEDMRMYGSRMSYSEKDHSSKTPRFILLGSTGIWNNGPTLQMAPLSAEPWQGCYMTEASHGKPSSPWIDRHAPIDRVPRAQGEEALLAFNHGKHAGQAETSVLCLSGLWGHGRSPRRFVGRLAPNKEALAKLGSVHLVHGHDVARAILAMHGKWQAARGERWLLTNERVYDLIDLVSQWGDAGEEGRGHVPKGPQLTWVQEIIAESRKGKHGNKSKAIRSLPRSVEQLGYGLDGTDFWDTFGLYPEVPWVD